MIVQCPCGCERTFESKVGHGQTKRYFSDACRQRAKRSRDRLREKAVTQFNVEVVRNSIICGDTLTISRRIPSQCVQMVCTSPPYYGLRDYGIPGQIGLENTPQAYITKLVDLFREVRRVLRDDGVLWLNLGDSYAGSGKGGQPTMYSEHWQPIYALKGTVYPGLAAKQLLGIPWRVALALQEDGWYLRSDIIWHKVNCVPESVRDRPTKSHEYIFLFSKQRYYYYDQKAIQEPNTQPRKRGETETHLEKNRRSVWSIPTQAQPFVHCATMAERLAELCILAGSRPGDLVLDPFMGAGTTALVAQKLGRQYLGIEINPEYIRLANERLATVQRHC